ncbi:MAG: hypothetical protein ACXW3D_06850, partial [Caulobacteraceae bacterium]
MPDVIWLHHAADPLESGELRRLGLAALAAEGAGWRCRFLHANVLKGDLRPDVLIIPARSLGVLPAFGADPRLVVELDDETAATDAEALATLQAVSSRLHGVVVHSLMAQARAAEWTPASSIWLAPDAADRRAELKAAAIRFGKPWGEPAPTGLPEAGDFWFAEAGDWIEDDEVERLGRAWAAPGELPRIAIAPHATLQWLRQAGIKADHEVASPFLPATLPPLLKCAVELGGASQTRRRQKAVRSGFAFSTAP